MEFIVSTGKKVRRLHLFFAGKMHELGVKISILTASRKYGNSNCDDFVTFILTASWADLDKLILTPSLDFLLILSASPPLYISSYFKWVKLKVQSFLVLAICWDFHRNNLFKS